MNKGTAFIQPHSDDAVMSMYYIIKDDYLPKPYFLVTVFSESDWIDPIQRIFTEEKHPNLSLEDITNLRKREDTDFANNCNMVCKFLNIPDCKIRSGGAIFDPEVMIDSIFVDNVRITINDALSQIQVETIVFPCPEGEKQHIDHRIVFNACSTISGYEKYLSDDFPYSRIPDLNSYTLEKQIFATSILDKFKAMSLYKTQMNSYFYEDVLNLHNQNKGAERLFKIL